MQKKHKIAPKTLGLLTLIFGVPAAPCAADILSADWVGPNFFNYRVSHMPDLDQRRSTLPCSGNIHCVPTCATNLVAYAANHGFPSVNPGPHFWEGNGNYVLASATIQQMGVNMQTSCAEGGTDGGPANTALVAWLANNPGLVVNDHLNVPNYATTFNGIGKSLCAGRIGSISYGYYDVIGVSNGTLVVDRDGGHCVTVAKIRRNGAQRELWVRNPASDEGNNFAQSPFINDIFTVTDLTVLVSPNMDLKTLAAINYMPGQQTIKLIDSHRTITPKVGYSWDASLGAVVNLGPNSLMAPALPPTHYPSPTATAVLSLDWCDMSGEYLAVCAGVSGQPNTLRAIDPLDGSSRLIALAQPPVLACAGRGHTTYVATTNVSAGDQLTTIVCPEPQTPPPSQPILTLPHPAHAMVVDPMDDGVVVLSRVTRKLMRIDGSLTGSISIMDIPSSVPLGTTVQLAINPLEPGIVWLWSSAGNTLYRLAVSSGSLVATTMTNANITNAKGFDFDDRGHMFVSNNGSVLEFLFDAAGGWQLVPAGPFSGQPAGTMLRITRSSTNFTAGFHDTPGWTRNIDADLIEPFAQKGDCAADIAPTLNTDGLVNIDDLLKVINGWGPCASQILCASDIVESGTTDIDDLLAVINGWGPCP